jgi:hypothetical protein
MRRLLDSDGHVVKTFHYDDNRIVIQQTQDVEAIVEDNKRRQSERPTGFFRKLASVPTVVLYQWMLKDGIAPGVFMRMKKAEKMAWYRRHLNDSDNKYLRTVEGQI